MISSTITSVKTFFAAAAASNMSMRIPALLLMAAIAASGAASAENVSDALRAGGVAILMRHATAPGTFDPEGFRIGDCSVMPDRKSVV